MKKIALSLVVLSSLLLLTGCNDSKSSSASTAKKEDKFSSNLSAEETAALDKEMHEMFKHAVIDMNHSSKDGCKISMSSQVSILRDDNVESVVYQKALSNSASKECGNVSYDTERAVVVSPPDTCEREYSKNGNIVKMSSCGVVTTINLTTKIATAISTEDGEKTETTIKSISINKSELTKELSSVTIIYKKADAQGEEVESSREIGNALKLLNINL